MLCFTFNQDLSVVVLRMNLKAARTKARRHVENLHLVGGTSEWNQDGSSGGGDRSSHSRYILKIKPTEFADGLDVGNEREREVYFSLEILE